MGNKITGKDNTGRKTPGYGCLFPMQMLVASAPFLIGVFEEYISSVVAVILLVFLFVTVLRNKRLVIKREPVIIAVSVIEVFFLLSPLWAVDKGMTLMGFVKFLPVLLFVMLLHQNDRFTPSSYLKFVPHSGIVMTALSFVLSRFPVLKDYFLVSGRLAGFYQYSNTFAVFLLLGIILLMFRKERRLFEYIGTLVLAAGIFLSGSRTVFILFMLVAVVFVIKEKNKTIKIVAAACVAIMLAGTILYATLTGNYDVVGRYLTSSLSSSTFIGRFLYFRDAIPQILTHPLGFGYLGYRSVQGSFQSGVYSIVHIHNDLLQIMLDIGWIPAIVCLIAVIMRFKKGMKFTFGLALAVILLHCLFDFDLQFVSIDLIVAVLLYENKNVSKELEINKMPALIASSVIVLWAFYLGMADMAASFGMDSTAVKIYPGYTDSWIAILQDSKDASEYDALGSRILSLNDSCSIAYSARARAAFSRGDLYSMMELKKKAISLNRYSLAEYLDYFDMLYYGASLFIQNADNGSAQICINEMLNIPVSLEEVRSSTSDLGWKIDDQPELDLPQEYLDIIGSLTGA